MNKRLSDLAADVSKSFGSESAALGGLKKKRNVIPTGSLALDYELGVGGWPLGYLIGIYGRRDIGKSSTLGFGALRSAQQMGLNCAIVAVEPNFDEAWATKHGVDVDEVLLTYPISGEEAFAMAHKIVKSGAVDFLLFDSLGAILSESEMEEDGKPKVAGQAGLITWGVKAIAPWAFRNNVCVMLVNQVRQDMKARVPGVYKQPGGEALEHMESIIVRLRPGSGKYTIKENGSDIVVGQEIICTIERNKVAEGSMRKASFDFFQMQTDQYPFGIDVFSDIINTARRVGVIKSRGSWFDLPNGESQNGMKAVAEYLVANPLVMELVREQVLHKMDERNAGKPVEVEPVEAHAGA